MTLMSESLRNDGRGDKRAPAEIPGAERDYYLERIYPVFGNLVPRDIASRAAKNVCDEGRGVGPGGLGVYLDFSDAIKRLAAMRWMPSTATYRTESCGGHFRAESRTPQGQPERDSRVLDMAAHDDAGFGGCTNTGECTSVCPKGIPLDTIARLNRDYRRAVPRASR